MGGIDRDLHWPWLGFALEQAFETSPVLRRPRPDLSKLTQPTVSLKSIVTAPPIFNTAGESATGTTGTSTV